jgi:two-component system CheB/CheR fusion protein
VAKARVVYSSVKPIFVVAVGGSVGGLAAYKALLSALPSDTGMAFVIVSHMMTGAISHLSEILSHYTTMNVIPAFTGMPILANQVYVNSPNSDILVENGIFKLIHPRTGRNRDVDRFFKSLAEER